LGDAMTTQVDVVNMVTAGLMATAALLLLVSVYLQLRLTVRVLELHSKTLSDLLRMMQDRVGGAG